MIERLVKVEEELKALREVQMSMMREMNARFEAVEERFKAMDTRFESLEKRISFMEWFMGIGFTVIVVLMSLYRFLG